ncbi:MAG: hypothetical protein RLZZ511_1770 [Cyanobacteriota bacterium]|jgi:peptide/nickel transport system permease protein
MTRAAHSPSSTIVRRLLAAFTGDTALYIYKRLGQGLITLLLASIFCFIVIQLAPGDFVSQYKENPTMTPERMAQIRADLGLDKSWPAQYFFWLTGILTRGDFGPSAIYGFRSATSLIMERVPATLLLALSSFILTWAIGIPLGIISAVQQRGWLDKVLRVVSYIGQGFPSFITALLLLIVAQNTSPLFPVSDMTSTNHNDMTGWGKVLDIAWHMILPTIALSITGFAGLQRIARGEMLDVLRQDYIQTARAKGLPENRVIYVHALRNAVNPLITLLGFEFASLLSGAFITEFFFNWPGLGRLTLQAVQAQDLYLLMASLMVGATMLILGNLLADVLLKFVDPRIKLSDMD